MWIARDKDGRLWLYENEPKRERNEFKSSKYFYVAELNGEFNPFSKVTWENSPLELIIKHKEK